MSQRILWSQILVYNFNFGYIYNIYAIYIYNMFSFAKLKMCKYENNCFYFTTLKLQFPYIVEKRKY